MLLSSMVSVVEKKKVTTITVVTFFYGGCCREEESDGNCYRCLLLWWCCKEKKNDDNFRHFLRWLYCKKQVTTIDVEFFGGFALKKVTTIISYGGGVIKKTMATSCHRLLSFFIFLLIWSFWFNSLELTINNELVVFF